jgi:beta-lactamase class A
MQIIKFFVALAVIAAVVFGGIHVAKAVDTHNKNQARKAALAKAEAERQERADKLATLKTELQASIDDYSGVSTSVSVIDLATGERMHAGLDVAFRAASTTKVLSAAAYLREVSEGRAKLDTIIKGTTAQSLLERMLRNSDNNAWAAIDTYLGDNTLTAFATSLQLDSYGVANNILDTEDMATLLYKLERNELGSNANTQLIRSFMQDTNNETLIPPALPASATVYHKFGLYEGELHDAAVIQHNGHRYVLVIYTNNQRATLSDGASRTELIHALTAKVVTSFESD